VALSNWLRPEGPKLTGKQAQEIRSLRGIPYKDLAGRYGVGLSQISRIMRNLAWPEPGPPRCSKCGQTEPGKKRVGKGKSEKMWKWEKEKI
jgi:hypothetical protein